VPSELSENETLPRLLFVTGRLAAPLVRRVVKDLSRDQHFDFGIEVVGISVAALMHVDLLKRKLTIAGPFDRVYVPGWCQGDLKELEAQFGIPFARGPKDILELGAFFGSQQKALPDLSRFDIEIIAEINHAPKFRPEEILDQAQALRRDGADIIDLGCIPGRRWKGVGDVVRLLRDAGLRVSIDSFDREEVEAAVAQGAELVLSCNRSNLDWAVQLDAEVVVIPDDPAELETMWETVQRLQDQSRRFRLDPILEPIGFGFAKSLSRYFEVRRQDPMAAVMMGIGNITELSDVDSAGLNFLLAAICQELGIKSVLTTQVISWCRTSVAEFDRARRLVKFAIENSVPPKRLDDDLILLRDARVTELGAEALRELASGIKDPNFRIFVERGSIHVMNRDGYWQGCDAFELFDRFSEQTELDAAHAFYLGYELSKAVTALTLGKQYQQDQALRWGFLTVPEVSAHQRRKDHRKTENP
jgi:dihydropteroate synthase-like protein